MLESLLIANRGEIARRIIRTARRWGSRTIAVYSDADADAPFVREADKASASGRRRRGESYLDGGKSSRPREKTRRRRPSIPGYGFLSENAAFAEAVLAAGLIWVGRAARRDPGDGPQGCREKLMQRRRRAGYARLSGRRPVAGAACSARRRTIGYPVLIKAVAGGGGKGMRRVDAGGEFADALSLPARGGRRLRRRPGAAGKICHAAAPHRSADLRRPPRQCRASVRARLLLQRRHQKVIEEAPAPGMDPATRDFLCAAAVKAARGGQYAGAGTVEFIADLRKGSEPTASGSWR